MDFRGIAKQFRKVRILEEENVSSKQQEQNVPLSFAEPLALSTDSEENVLRLDKTEIPPMYREVRSFLRNTSAYKWLLANIRSSAMLTERNGTLLETIPRHMESKFSTARSSPVFEVRLNIDWNLPNFLRDQEYDGRNLDVALEHAITITGTDTTAQALNCISYMSQTWPLSGCEVVRALQKALSSTDLSYSSKQSHSTIQIFTQSISLSSAQVVSQ